MTIRQVTYVKGKLLMLFLFIMNYLYFLGDKDKMLISPIWFHKEKGGGGGVGWKLSKLNLSFVEIDFI